MNRVLAVTSALLIGASAGVDAHRLDEYLQAARVAVTPTSVVVYLDLTPGVTLAADIIGRLDGDGDGRVSPVEAEAYGRAVVADLEARLDGAPLPLALGRVEVPTTGEMRDGVGTIRVELTADVVGPSPGRHLFELRNMHRSDQGVYLANALMPETSDVAILRQQRDLRQQAFQLHYEVRSIAGDSVLWLLCGAAGLLAHARWRLHSVPAPTRSH
jgi:hypothetical protein